MFILISQKNIFVFAEQTCPYKALNQYSTTLKFQLRSLIDFKTNIEETENKMRKYLKSFNVWFFF